MGDEQENQNDDVIDLSSYKSYGLIALSAVVILIIITVAAYRYAKGKSGTVVLPGGVTYLGPSVAPAATAIPQQTQGKYSAAEGVAWQEIKGEKNPFSFSVPVSLKTTKFPNDITDSVAIDYGGVPVQQNIFFRVIDIETTEPTMKKYINKPKLEYVENWWTQWGALKGAKPIVAFTNSHGMKGYKTRYINHSNEANNIDIFFEIPGSPGLMVRFASGVIEEETMDKITDTFKWGSTTSSANPTTAAQPETSQ